MSETAAVITMEKAATAVVPAGPRSTMDMIHVAVERGSSIEVIERLMALHERWEAGQARQAFENAVADAKAEIPTIIKNRKVDFTSAKGRTNYEYEDLAEIAETINPIISKYGLSYRFRSAQGNGKVSVTCVLSHRKGHFEETMLEAKEDQSGNKNDIQGIGSTATFLQRYTLKLALGLAAAKDDDGRSARKSQDELINEEQLNELLELADDVGADKRKFCSFYKIESFAEIRQSQLEAAKRALNAKRKAAPNA